MKQLVLILSILLIFILIFFRFAPEDRVNSVTVAYKRLIKDPGQLCFDDKTIDNEVKLKDLESARIVKVDFDLKYDLLLVTYKSKNSFGAYVENVLECDLLDGKYPISAEDQSQVSEARFQQALDAVEVMANQVANKASSCANDIEKIKKYTSKCRGSDCLETWHSFKEKSMTGICSKYWLK